MPAQLRSVWMAALVSLALLTGCNLPTTTSPTPTYTQQPSLEPSASPTPTYTPSPTPTPTSTPSLAPTPTFAGPGVWGRLANPGYENHPIRTSLFFAGQARDGSTWYDCSAASNLGLYTVHPSDTRHLEWSASEANRIFALERMAAAGLNVISMSTWGEDFLPCSTGWVPFAPMQTASGAQDQVFEAAVSSHLLVMPFIESRGDWAFRDEFPSLPNGEIAPGTVGQIVNLVVRYLKNPDHPEWAAQWAQVFDHAGEPRYAVTIIHASSNHLPVNGDTAFAHGFDVLADVVFQSTGVRVGFFIDPLPPHSNAPGAFRPSPEGSGALLAQTDAILGIQSFIPEIWVPGSPDESQLIVWKWDYSKRWTATGIPFLMDVSPGYDAHVVFPGSIIYGFTDLWQGELTAMVSTFKADGLAFNSWNGYTEGMAAVPTVEHGERYYLWLQALCAVVRGGD
jgi:hypothetical protein